MCNVLKLCVFWRSLIRLNKGVMKNFYKSNKMRKAEMTFFVFPKEKMSHKKPRKDFLRPYQLMTLQRVINAPRVGRPNQWLLVLVIDL